MQKDPRGGGYYQFLFVSILVKRWWFLIMLQVFVLVWMFVEVLCVTLKGTYSCILGQKESVCTPVGS